MVVTAQTPDHSPSVSSTVNSAQSQDNQALTRSDSALSREAAQVSQRHSASLRFSAAAVCLVLALLGGLGLSLNPGEQPSTMLAFVICAIAGIITVSEGVTAWIVRPRQHSVFDPIALLGAICVIAATSLGIFATSTPHFSVLLVTAPALAAAALCIGSGFSILGANASRGDTDYLFPKALSRSMDFKLGERFSIKSGQLIPVDGRIQNGSVGLDERSFSPVPTFRIREEQEVVLAGSEVLAGSGEVTALSTIDNSCLAQLQQAIKPMVQEAQDSLKDEDSRSSQWTAFAICFMAAAIAISWRERSALLHQPLLAAGMILLVATICQMATYLYGQRKALVQSWLAKGFLLAQANSVKDLSRITSVECDSSRCVNSSLLRARQLEILDDRLSGAALCDFIGSLLGRAEDGSLLAAADYCRKHAGKLSLERVVDLREYPGRGICGTIHGVELSVGGEDFLVERGIMVQPTEGESSDASFEPSLLVAIDDDVVARFILTTSQEEIVASDECSLLFGDIPATISSGVARELREDALLIRGRESDLIGQTAMREITLFSPEEGAVKRSTVVAFTPSIENVGDLLAECRAHVRATDRLRLLTGFSGLVTVVAAFAGVLTPLIPCAWLVLTAVTMRLSQRPT